MLLQHPNKIRCRGELAALQENVVVTPFRAPPNEIRLVQRKPRHPLHKCQR